MLFIRNLIAGYEPVMVRNIAVALFAMLATFGVGTGNLPPWADGVLVFLALVVPLAAGWSARRQVSPVKSFELPVDPYADGYAAAMEQYEHPAQLFDGPGELEIADYEGEKFAPPLPDDDNR